MNKGYYCNQIEAVMGIQLYCVFNIDEYGQPMPDATKIYRFNANIDIPTFQANQTYFFGFMDWIRENYHNALNKMANCIPSDKNEYVLQRCAFIVAATFQPNDIVTLKKIQTALSVSPERANIIVNEIIDNVKYELEIQKYIQDFGKYGFIKQDAFSKIKTGIIEHSRIEF